MIKTALSLLFLIASAQGFTQTGYSISLTLKPYKAGQVYLGYHYGKLKAVADSAILDHNGSCTFKGKDKLPGGIYFIVSPQKQILFEVLIDEQQHFSIAGDSTGNPL